MKPPKIQVKPCCYCQQPIQWTRLLGKEWDSKTLTCSNACKRHMNRDKRSLGLPVGAEANLKYDSHGNRIWKDKKPKLK